VGFLDRAKKLAEQAKDLAEGALADASAKSPSTSPAPAHATTTATEYGTPYVPGMLGREGWRERGLEDPAAVLPIAERDRAGIPHSTKSEIVEEPYGMGRRWSSGGRALGLFYALHPEHQSWQAPGSSPLAEVPGATTTELPDGRSLVFVHGGGSVGAVLELTGFDPGTRAQLAAVVASHL
jgi:hypothetical protein